MTGLTLLRAYENHWFPLIKTAIKPLFLGQKLCGWRHPPQQNSPQSFAFWETIYFPFGTPEAHSQWLDFLLGKFLIEVGTQNNHLLTLRIRTPPKWLFWGPKNTEKREIRLQTDPSGDILKSCSLSGRKFLHEKNRVFRIHPRWFSRQIF